MFACYWSDKHNVKKSALWEVFNSQLFSEWTLFFLHLYQLFSLEKKTNHCTHQSDVALAVTSVCDWTSSDFITVMEIINDYFQSVCETVSSSRDRLLKK